MQRWIADGVRVQMCVTSPPYFGLRDYGHIEQIGLEKTPAEYVSALVEVFDCVRDLLADDGVLWLNLGDSYAGTGKSGGGVQGQRWQECGMDVEGPRGGKWVPPPIGYKAKDLMGIPWRVAFALQAAGWYLRQDIIWHKPNPMPESVTDRCTKAHEYLFLLAKSQRYYWDAEAMRERAVAADIGAMDGGPQRHADGTNANDGRNFRDKAHSFKREGSKRAVIPGQKVGTHRAEREESTYDIYTRNRRSVWTVATRPYKGAHFATFPPDLIEPCVLAGSRPGDVVLDPFIGSGTTAQVALRYGRQFLGCELNPAYATLQQERIGAVLVGDLL